MIPHFRSSFRPFTLKTNASFVSPDCGHRLGVHDAKFRTNWLLLRCIPFVTFVELSAIFDPIIFSLKTDFHRLPQFDCSQTRNLTAKPLGHSWIVRGPHAQTKWPQRQTNPTRTYVDALMNLSHAISRVIACAFMYAFCQPNTTQPNTEKTRHIHSAYVYYIIHIRIRRQVFVDVWPTTMIEQPRHVTGVSIGVLVSLISTIRWQFIKRVGAKHKRRAHVLGVSYLWLTERQNNTSRMYVSELWIEFVLLAVIYLCSNRICLGNVNVLHPLFDILRCFSPIRHIR